MSKCIICFHLRTQPAVYGDKVWCRKSSLLGLLPINHDFIRAERACDKFDDEEPEVYYRPPMEG